MNGRYLRLAGVLGLLVIGLQATGCNSAVGETQRESQSIELGEADAVRVELTMNAGKLELSGGADELMEGKFTYNVAEWKPRVTYERADRQGKLVIEQTPISVDTSDIWKILLRGTAFQDFRNEWRIQLSEAVPLALNLTLGAGESSLDLEDLTLTELNLTMGAGKTTVDLSEIRPRSLQVNISGGAGEIEVRLPEQIGVQIEVEHGPGEVTEEGLKREGKAYVNDAYGKSETTIEISIQAGFGSIRLIED
jgi:predicted membrane protein